MDCARFVPRLRPVFGCWTRASERSLWAGIISIPVAAIGPQNMFLLRTGAGEAVSFPCGRHLRMRRLPSYYLVIWALLSSGPFCEQIRLSSLGRDGMVRLTLRILQRLRRGRFEWTEQRDGLGIGAYARNGRASCPACALVWFPNQALRWIPGDCFADCMEGHH